MGIRHAISIYPPMGFNLVDCVNFVNFIMVGCYCLYVMTRPMTGQPKTEEEMTNATQRANKELTEDVPEDIKNDPMTKDSLKDDTESFKDTDAWAELKEIEETVDQNTGSGINTSEDDEKEMKVVDDSGEVHTLTQEEVENRRDVQTRVWNRLERNGGMFVRVAQWFNDAEINKVKTGRGFYGQKVGETEKALQIEVSAEDGNHNAGAETVWIPKKAATTYELE